MTNNWEHGDRPSLYDRWKGCLLLGAAGDAFGYEVEFNKLPKILQTYGGRLNFADTDNWRHGNEFIVSDDTQMTLFTAEACGNAFRREMPMDWIIHDLFDAYLNWLLTQKNNKSLLSGTGTLLDFPVMYKAQAPGFTCLTALKAGLGGGGPMIKSARVNDSMGCGGVMRVAPMGFLQGISNSDCFHYACRSAAITHGHDMGIYPSGAMALIIREITKGDTIANAVRTAIKHMNWSDADPLNDLLEQALQFEGKPTISPEEYEALGGGWVGHECLAMGVAAAVMDATIEERLTVAANHSGDSDSTASICGQLVGAHFGFDALTSLSATFRHVFPNLDVIIPIEFTAEKFASSCFSKNAPEPN